MKCVEGYELSKQLPFRSYYLIVVQVHY